MTNLENPLDKADEIAAAFKPFGLILGESEYYYCQHEFYTLLDYLKENPDMLDPIEAWLLHRAFRKAGFKYASECTIKELVGEQAATGYAPYAMRVAANNSNDTYAYDHITDQKRELHEELIPRVKFHPSRIQKWIEAGNDIEDYLP